MARFVEESGEGRTCGVASGGAFFRCFGRFPVFLGLLWWSRKLIMAHPVGAWAGLSKNVVTGVLTGIGGAGGAGNGMDFGSFRHHIIGWRGWGVGR